MTAPAPVSPVYFPTSGDWNAIVDPALSGTATTPVVQPINALLTFVPRVPKGFVAYIDNFAISGDVNAVQTITILGPVSSGTFALNVLGVWTPTPIPFNADAATVAAAIQACSTVGANNCLVQGGVGGPWACEFTNALGNMPVPIMRPDYSLLGSSSGGAVTVTVEPTVIGSAARTGPSALAIPSRQGRIWFGQLCSIDVADTPGVQLLANMPELNLGSLDISELIYDVMFTQVTYAAAPQDVSNFAFAAPVDATPICITDPDLPRMPWQPPSN